MISVSIKLDKEISDKNKEDLIKAATYIVEQILFVNSDTIHVSIEANGDEIRWLKRIIYSPDKQKDN